MTYDIDHGFIVDSNILRVWEFLWNVEAVARCIPGCAEVSVVQETRYYTAQVRKKMGPFSVAIHLDVEIVEARPPDFLSVSIKGNDRRLRSEVTQVLSLQLTEIAESTQLQMRGEFSMTGLLGNLNRNLIAMQVSQVLDEFSSTLRQSIVDSSARSYGQRS